MKLSNLLSITLISLTFGILLSCSPSEKSSTSEIILKDKADTVSWIIGTQIADNFKQQNLDVALNKDVLYAAMKAQFESDTALFDPQKGNQIIGEFMAELSKSEYDDKIAEGKAFLEKNAQREEITVTESGLQYEIITEGTGNIPTANNTVKTHYHGTLIDGTVFDSSYERGQPAEFPVNGVIKGWVEALQLMPVGSKWKLYIPYNLAYGERGAGKVIGPYETLIFDIELIEIVK
jgi:FKBP-type peptidyl-prolyl cis-trans isomerase FklB